MSFLCKLGIHKLESICKLEKEPHTFLGEELPLRKLPTGFYCCTRCGQYRRDKTSWSSYEDLIQTVKLTIDEEFILKKHIKNNAWSENEIP